jgi:hypothetical protein
MDGKENLVYIQQRRLVGIRAQKLEIETELALIANRQFGA